MPNNTIDLQFADGEYTFALPLPQIFELQSKCGVGIGGLFARVLKGCAMVDGKIILSPEQADFFALDLVETIRQGLIGGGKGVVNGVEIAVTPVLAENLLKGYVHARPLIESWNFAFSILAACIVGYDPPKKEPPAEERAEATAETDDSITP